MELENLGLCDLEIMYKMNRIEMNKKVGADTNEEDDDHIIESNSTFNCLEEHPSHRYIVMSKRIIVILRIGN